MPMTAISSTKYLYWGEGDKKDNFVGFSFFPISSSEFIVVLSEIYFLKTTCTLAYSQTLSLERSNQGFISAREMVTFLLLFLLIWYQFISDWCGLIDVETSWILPEHLVIIFSNSVEGLPIELTVLSVVVFSISHILLLFTFYIATQLLVKHLSPSRSWKTMYGSILDL